MKCDVCKKKLKIKDSETKVHNFWYNDISYYYC